MSDAAAADEGIVEAAAAASSGGSIEAATLVLPLANLSEFAARIRQCQDCAERVGAVVHVAIADGYARVRFTPEGHAQTI